MPRTSMLAVAATLALVTDTADRRELLAQSPAFRAGVDLISLSVTVTDSAQRPIGNIDRDAFVVLENGVPQDLTFFGKTNVP